MKTALIILSIVLLAGVIFVFWVIWMRWRNAEIFSFWDVVRNPFALSDLDRFQKHVGASAAAMSGSASKIGSLVDFFVFEAKSSSDAWTEKRILAKLGAKAYPRALEILRDSSTQERLVVLTDAGHSSRPEAPICRLAEIFEQDDQPPPEVADLLAPFLRSESAEIRKSVALAIGSTGSLRSLPGLQLALTDENDYVKSFALIGIKRAISRARIDAPAKAQFYETVAGMWPKDTCFHVCDQIPKILLCLDRERAIERLLRPDLFTAKFSPVWSILSAFAKESVVVPRPRLLALIDEAGGEPIKYPMNNVLEGALHLLGQHRAEEDLPTLERFVDHPDAEVLRGATKGLYAYHRYSELIRDPWERVAASGWEALTEAEKHICAIEELDDEVNNGGFAQYYLNSGGNHWQEALKGVAAIGAPQRRDILATTIGMFGPSKPSRGRFRRNLQLSKVVRKWEDSFNAQDTAWYNIKDEPLDRLKLRYNLANAEGRQKPSGVPPGRSRGWVG